MSDIGIKVDNDIDHFKPPEGSLNMYYGRIGSGKTYSATADIIDLLKAGQVIYCSWPIDLEKYFDDRESFFITFFNTLFRRKEFYRIHSYLNFHYFSVLKRELYDYSGKVVKSWSSQSDFIVWLDSLSYCHIFIDEAYRLFDSYEKTNMSMTKRAFALETRHNFRHINILAQRPTSIQVSQRSQVNRFYKCVKIATWPWVRFGRFEFQDMVSDTVDEMADPVSKKVYWGRMSIFMAYNSYYLGKVKSQDVFFDTFLVDFKGRMRLLINNFLSLFSFLKKTKRIKDTTGVPLGIPTLTGVKSKEKSIKSDGRLNTAITGSVKQPLSEVLPF